VSNAARSSTTRASRQRVSRIHVFTPYDVRRVDGGWGEGISLEMLSGADSGADADAAPGTFPRAYARGNARESAVSF